MDRDRIERVSGALVQHGPLNDRVYVMRLGSGEPSRVLGAVEGLAAERGYSKIFAKVPSRAAGPFLDSGFTPEAVIPGLYRGREKGVFLGKFLRDWRARERCEATVRRVIETARAKRGTSPRISRKGRAETLGPGHASQMALLYGEVFDSYPFPIFDPAYLRQTMAEHIRYFGVVVGDTLAALASSEMDPAGGSVELTDFATRTQYRGRGLAGVLIRHMERCMAERGLSMGYTIARAESYGMNIAFARAGYRFGGTLVNNTNIAGRLESMNVWYRPLERSGDGAVAQSASGEAAPVRVAS